MYEYLVKSLRELAGEQMFDFERKHYLQAADAIEQLSHHIDDCEKIADHWRRRYEELERQIQEET